MCRRERNVKCATLAGFTSYADMPAMCLYDLLGHRQTNPKPRIYPGIISSEQRHKNAIDIISRYTNSFIRDRY